MSTCSQRRTNLLSVKLALPVRVGAVRIGVHMLGSASDEFRLKCEGSLDAVVKLVPVQLRLLGLVEVVRQIVDVPEIA